MLRAHKLNFGVRPLGLPGLGNHFRPQPLHSLIAPQRVAYAADEVHGIGRCGVGNEDPDVGLMQGPPHGIADGADRRFEVTTRHYNQFELARARHIAGDLPVKARCQVIEAKDKLEEEEKVGGALLLQKKP
jgi:hypothetical protein